MSVHQDSCVGFHTIAFQCYCEDIMVHQVRHLDLFLGCYLDEKVYYDADKFFVPQV